jgi:uracil phosphoribosyltransferase
MKPHRDTAHQNLSFRLSEQEHKYGPNVHLLSDPFLTTQLARLCSTLTTQPLIQELVTQIYTSLIRTVVNQEFPRTNVTTRSRMSAQHPEGVFEHQALDPSTSAVSVNLARAGTLPSMICYQTLNYLLDPAKVRQDNISIARQTDKSQQVTGSLVSGHKIGGPVDGAIVMIPDPMGATGSTVVETFELYQSYGKAKKWVALHCIVTPEYLKKVTRSCPDLQIYAIRLDRGLSQPDVLNTIPGTHWDQEKGLNDHQYIVPGGGGFGEIMNNAYV